MPDFTVFDPTTGEVISSGSAGSLAQVSAQVADGLEILLGHQVNRETQFVVGGAAFPRPALSLGRIELIADGVQVAEIALPDGTEIEWQGERHKIYDGVFAYRTQVPGEHELLIIPAFPYRRQTVRVIAYAV